jgi:hypothetical protein
MAAERGRWPDHWRVADLDFEEEALLDLLEADEDLLAVVPGIRSNPTDGDQQVLIAATNRRVVLVSRSKRGSGALRVVDVTTCSCTAPRQAKEVPHRDGLLIFDVDDAAIARLWASIDDVHGTSAP